MLLNKLVVDNSENIKRIYSEIKYMKNRVIATPNPKEEDMDEGKEGEESNLAIKKCRMLLLLNAGG